MHKDFISNEIQVMLNLFSQNHTFRSPGLRYFRY